MKLHIYRNNYSVRCLKSGSENEWIISIQNTILMKQMLTMFDTDRWPPCTIYWLFYLVHNKITIISFMQKKTFSHCDAKKKADVTFVGVTDSLDAQFNGKKN